MEKGNKVENGERVHVTLQIPVEMKEDLDGLSRVMESNLSQVSRLALKLGIAEMKGSSVFGGMASWGLDDEE